MKKFRFFLRLDKEEKWLERMAGDGWMLSGKSMLYHFCKAVPENRTIRIDYREMKSAKDFSDYCALFEDSGWRHIAGTRHSGMQYFLKMNDDGAGDIFSDTISRAGRYKRLSHMWLSGAIVFLPLIPVSNFDIMFSPKEWYYTPGLWELEGVSFWQSFLFETPFALMRGIGCLLPIAGALIYIGFAIKLRALYRSEIKN